MSAYSHDINYTPPAGITIEAQADIRDCLWDQQAQSGQVAAKSRGLRQSPEPYIRAKRVRYVGEYVRQKEGKKK